MNKHRTPTIYHVAQQAGVSIATVSRVLNSPNQVNEETRGRVFAAIDQLGYTPRADASARARKEVRRIGVLTPFFTFASFVQRMRGVATALDHANYELVIYPVSSREERDYYFSMLPATNRVDGLVVISMPLTEDAASRLQARHLEAVLIESGHPAFSSVEINDYAGGVIAAERFLATGRQRLAYLGDVSPPNYGVNPLKKRLEGYQAHLQQAGITLEAAYTYVAHRQHQNAYNEIHHALTTSNPPDALFAATDDFAMVALKVAREIGLNVPDDLAIIGFDDVDVADYLGLTTIRQPLDDSGRTAVELLLSRLTHRERPVRQVELPLSLIVRKSA